MKYCISWISFFDNNLYSKVVVAKSELEALGLALKEVCSTTDQIFEVPDFPTPDLCKSFAFDCDSMVNAICIEEP